MSELRWDPLGGEWALIATERGLRPSDFAPGPRPLSDQRAPCPFCLVLAGRGPATQIAERRTRGDRVLVVANRFPALSVEASGERRAVGPYDLIDGVGAHEVVIETAGHDTSFASLPVEHLAEVLLAWRDRVGDLVRDRRIHHVQIFKNDGPRAGATLAHAHSQVLAAPIRPPRVARRMELASAHWQRKERCLLCDIVHHETHDKARVVEVSGGVDAGFVAWCPYASRHPFEVWIAPRRHSPDFAALGADEARELARILKGVLRGLDAALMGADVNLLLSLAPSAKSFTREREGLEHAELWWHWHLELVPRLTSYGGYELATGVVINPTAPEDAAEHLRSLA
ncbi:MAG: galactose-1-phosphate uridylyltransferase [Deltaproteobacteria bacterium]|nr:galactose-1-phosphate uridylyltransferase [Deltaproteobacteria bacterium]